MTNELEKQIIIYKKECYNEPHCSLNQVLEQLNAYKMEAKEVKEINAELKAENDELQKIIDEAKNSNLDLKSFLVGEAIQNEYEQQLDQLKQTLTEIKPILEYYANSTIGEEQEDGTYRIELSHKYGSSNMYGAPCYYKYNPKPARQALQKISEVSNDMENN